MTSRVPPPPPRGDWVAKAACKGSDPVIFDLETEQAYWICSGCPVREACLADAMQLEAEGGSWGPGTRGGLTASQRIALKRHGRYRPAEWLPKPPRKPYSQLPLKEISKRLDLWSSGLSDGQIADKCGVTSDSIRGWRIRYKSKKHPNGLPANKPSWAPMTQEQAATRLNMAAQGFTDAQIAQIEGVTVTAVTLWRKRRARADARAANDRKAAS